MTRSKSLLVFSCRWLGTLVPRSCSQYHFKTCKWLGTSLRNVKRNTGGFDDMAFFIFRSLRSSRLRNFGTAGLLDLWILGRADRRCYRSGGLNV